MGLNSACSYFGMSLRWCHWCIGNSHRRRSVSRPDRRRASDPRSDLCRTRKLENIRLKFRAAGDSERIQGGLRCDQCSYRQIAFNSRSASFRNRSTQLFLLCYRRNYDLGRAGLGVRRGARYVAAEAGLMRSVQTSAVLHERFQYCAAVPDNT